MLGISQVQLPKYEEELELKIAKTQLEELKKDALEAMETQEKKGMYPNVILAMLILASQISEIWNKKFLNTLLFRKFRFHLNANP